MYFINGSYFFFCDYELYVNIWFVKIGKALRSEEQTKKKQKEYDCKRYLYVM